MNSLPPDHRAPPANRNLYSSANSPGNLVVRGLHPRPMGVSDFTQLALWMAASLAGLVTAMLTARGPSFRRMALRVGWSPQQRSGGCAARRPSREQALPMLADATVGNCKAAVASVFGPPRGAVLVNAPAGATFWDADTWYYLMPRGGKAAMAIEFHEDVARSVNFLRRPR